MAKVKPTKKSAAGAAAKDEMKEGIKFEKAKIKNELFLYVEYTEELPGHSKNKIKNDCTVPVHDDLKAAFQKLHIHLALICDQIRLPKKGESIDGVEYSGYEVHSFSVGGSDDGTGVTISGTRDARFGPVNLTTPFTKYVGGDYPYLSELGQDIIECEYEIDQYLFKGKKAPELQLEMEMPEGSDKVVEEDL